MQRDKLIKQCLLAFKHDLAAIPKMTLRGGNAVDSYDEAPSYDTILDNPDNAYLELHSYWGLIYLDADSWRHYLPILIDYSLRQLSNNNTMVLEGLLQSLYPSDFYLPRLKTLSFEQKIALKAFLEYLFSNDEASSYQEDALHILNAWDTLKLV